MRGYRRIPYHIVVPILWLLLIVPACAQHIQLEVANAVVVESHGGYPAVSVALTTDSKREFATFSTSVIGRLVEIRNSYEVLATIRLQTSIQNGVVQFNVRGKSVDGVVRQLSEHGAKLEIRVVEPR
jgi:hypothetical protein